MDNSLIYDISTRGESKWNLLTPSQRAKFLELLLLNATIEKLQLFHDQAVEANATRQLPEGASKEDKELAHACFEEWNDKVKTGRAHVWSVRGISEFRETVRETRATLRQNAQMVAEMAQTLTAVEREANSTLSEAGLKIVAAGYTKLATGIVNSHTPEGRALLAEASSALTNIRKREQFDAALASREKLKNRELDARDQSKVEAGLTAIERAAGRNTKVKAALAEIRSIMQGEPVTA